MPLKPHPTKSDMMVYTKTEYGNISVGKEWVGLTDEEIMDACSAVWASHPIEVGNIVQDLLREKNGASS